MRLALSAPVLACGCSLALAPSPPALEAWTTVPPVRCEPAGLAVAADLVGFGFTALATAATVGLVVEGVAPGQAALLPGALAVALGASSAHGLRADARCDAYDDFVAAQGAWTPAGYSTCVLDRQCPIGGACVDGACLPAP